MFGEKISEAQKKFGVTGLGGTFKFKEGTNKIRVLDGGEPIASHFVNNKAMTCFGKDKGCQYHTENDKKPSIKFVVYLLDQSLLDKEIQLAFLPWSVVKAIDTLEKSEDYAFQGLPMPYDLTVKYDPEADPNSMYTVMPSPNRVPMPDDVSVELEKKMPIKEVVERIKHKAEESSE